MPAEVGPAEPDYLGAGVAAAGAAAEDAGRLLVSVAGIVRVGEEETVDIAEVGAGLREADHAVAVPEQADAAGVTHAGQQLAQDRQPFLGGRGRRRTVAQESTHR